MSIVDDIRVRQRFSPDGYTFEKGLEKHEPVDTPVQAEFRVSEILIKSENRPSFTYRQTEKLPKFRFKDYSSGEK